MLFMYSEAERKSYNPCNYDARSSMDATVLNLVRAEPKKYAQKAEKLLLDAEAQLEEAATRYSKTTSQYCYKDTKLEQARAIHRAITTINTGQRVMFSDEVTLKRWISSRSDYLGEM